jgi:hypothetical protein
LTVKSDSTESSPGKWNQEGTAVLENLVADAGTDGKVEIASIAVTSQGRDVALAAWRSLMDRLEAMSASADAGGAEAAGASQEQMQQALTALRDAGSLLASYSAAVELNGVRFTDPSGAQAFSLSTAGVSFGLEGFDQEKSAVAFGYHHGGLALARPEMTGADPQLVQSLTPQELSLNITAENLPTRAVWTSFLETALSPDAQTPEQSQMAMGMFMASAQQAIMESGAQIRVADTRVVMPAGKASLDGTVQADPATPFGATGTLNLEITGLDTLISTVSAATTDPQEAQEMQGFFELLRGFSNRETAADGATVDRYALQVTKEGNLLLNGKDFSGFLGAMQGQP